MRHAARRVGWIAIGILGVFGPGCGGGGGGGGGGAALDPRLSSLSVLHGTLTPGFDANVTAYTVGPQQLPADMSIVAVTARTDETLTIGGEAAVSGVATEFVLPIGLTSVSVVVTAADGVTSRSYAVEFDRTSADLVSLVVSAGSLVPAFDASTLDYVVGPPVTDDTTTVTATTLDPTAGLTIQGFAVDSGSPSPSFSVTADTTTITVMVTPRGEFPRTYTILFDRVDAVFFDDFSGASLGAAWSGAGSLDAASGVPAPSLALAVGQTLEYVGTSASSASGVTLTVDVQRDVSSAAKLRLFEAGNPTNRWVSVFLNGTTIITEYGDSGAFAQGFQGSIPADDHLFHRLVLKVASNGTVTAALDGTTYWTMVSFPTTALRFSLSNPQGSVGANSRFDDVTFSSP